MLHFYVHFSALKRKKKTKTKNVRVNVQRVQGWRLIEDKDSGKMIQLGIIYWEKYTVRVN